MDSYVNNLFEKIIVKPDDIVDPTGTDVIISKLPLACRSQSAMRNHERRIISINQ